MSRIYHPEQQELLRKTEERELVREGIAIWKARKEQNLNQLRFEQSQVKFILHTVDFVK